MTPPLDFRYSSSSQNEHILFFQAYPLSQWSLELFTTYCNTKKPRPSSPKTSLSNYVLCLNNILDDPKVPVEVKNHVRFLLQTTSSNQDTSSTTVYNIGTHSTATVIGNVTGNSSVSYISGSKRPPQDQFEANFKKPKSGQTRALSNESEAGPSTSNPAIDSHTPLDNLEKAWVLLQQESDFSENAHKYRLESRGIIQCGRGLAAVRNIPEEIYALITLNASIVPQLPFDVFGDYIFNVMESPSYGTFDCTDIIYDKSALFPDHPKDVFVFVSRILQLFSDSIHHRLKPCNLTDSESAYCHYGIWPLMNQVVNQIQDAHCRFLVGETKLNAMNDKTTYLGDGTVYVQDSGLEIVLLEASGPYGNRDVTRNVYDHIKGAFGMYTMIKAILCKYPSADPALLSQASVLFLHASSRDNNIRLWQMTPTTCGKILLLERLCKGSISLDPTDTGAMVNLMQFLWSVKFYSEQAIAGIKALKNSHAKRIISNKYHDLPPLVSHIHPIAIKPKKNESLSGMCDLDPISFL